MSTADSEGEIQLTASCLCQNHVFTTMVPLCSLPLEASTCHCTSCRRVSGALYTHDAAWPGPLEAVTGDGLSLYQMTKNVALLFCGRCSSPMFWWERYEGRPEALDVLVGALEGPGDVQLIKTVRHAFIGDTVDGGAAPWLRTMGSGQEDIPMWMGKAGQSELLGPTWHTSHSKVSEPGPDEIPVACHCRGVNLVLRRGDAEFASRKREDLPFFVDPKDHQLLASFDACNSCRKSFGISVMNWTFTLLEHIAFADASAGTPFPTTTPELKAALSGQDRDERFGTLAYYASSPDVQRYFCSRCSASVFYAVDDRPQMVDLGIGLLDSPDGARAESRLAWALGPPVTWKGDAAGTWREDFVGKLEENTEAWRVATGREKLWLKADKERST
ncbi:hypothetical protein NLU13_5220 [Sarocladium strictum]|uniref:CENP-V/GFA domain-containing protein n=1 Tax=Sarocladium strictum TaxID=5046 RepID=A0AA39GIY1_SARSR|nr:hypothetical protein NLU13_5220 [Sarocladium strictum]